MQTIPGAVVECGVANGGSAAVLWHAAGKKRHLWMFDSFEGLPEPTAEDGGRAMSQWVSRHVAPDGWCKGSFKMVKEVLNLAQVPGKNIHIIPGWISETLPTCIPNIKYIAVLHVDVDWYRPTMDTLKWLYPLVVPGGIVIVDDYDAWPGCRLAVDEFQKANGIPTCSTWRKE
jgi:O-methyltransferase